MTLQRSDSAAKSGCLVASRGWRDSDHLERAARDQMHAFGPESGDGPVFVAFPWSALIDSLAEPPPALQTADLHTALRVLCADIAPGAAALTVCQHSGLRDHFALLAEAGITDVFWSHATPDDLEQTGVAGLRIHPFPALPRDDAPACAGEGPGGAFAFCPAVNGGNTPHLWAAIKAGLIPVLPLARAALPGLPALWHAGAVFHDGRPEDRAALPAHLSTIAGDPEQMQAMQDALRQLGLLYGAGPFYDAGRSTYGVILRMLALTRSPARLPMPRLAAAQGPAIFFLGPRGQRTPLSYAPLRHIAGARMRRVDHPDKADLILTGWNRDLEDNRALLRDTLARRPSTKIAVISEEPLWDSLWSGGFAARDRSLAAGDVEISYRFLNHVNSSIFDFHRIPYFLLTSDAFAARYAMLIAGFAALDARALLAHWRAAPLQCAFFCERRTTPDYSAHFPEQGLYGLSLYRSHIAALIPEGRVLRMGQGWAGTPQRRQNLPDWHLDKLAQLHGRVRVCGAQENTLLRDYITEKAFDAFAVGAVPAVVAGADHRLYDLIAPDAMLDTAGLAPDLAAARIAAFAPDIITAEAWLASAARLVSLFRDTGALIAERHRVVDATLDEIAALV